MQTSKKDDLNKFKSKIGVKADVPEVDVKGAANFNAKFEQSVGQETVQWDIEVYMDGVTGAYKMKGDKWTPAEVVKALNWFKQNEVGKPIMATLKQYSTLDASNTYPRTINIDPEVFGELSGLYAKLWEVRALFNALPENSTRKWKEAKDNFDRDVTANRKVLATDLRLRRDLTSKGSDLVSGLGKISGRRVFFTRSRALGRMSRRRVPGLAAATSLLSTATRPTSPTGLRSSASPAAPWTSRARGATSVSHTTSYSTAWARDKRACWRSTTPPS